jgi:UDP-GlcNAc:undecaprenyl-phosphate/decaprenyl-phosphate GlcNAc-1-phosphate transferase
VREVYLSLSGRVGVAIGLAAALAYVATPLAIQTARRFAFYDLPFGYKGHAKPTPYLGGAAVMVAFALAALVGAGDQARTLPLLGGVGILLVLGTIDDRVVVSAGLRIAVEFGLGALLAADGLGWRLGSGGVLDAAITGIWVVAVVNAFNLFDNMDGAASTMALVVSGGVCALAILTGDVWVAVGSAALCGACLGFLPHNLSAPARIFLGDGGSMPLGFAIAALVANAARSAEPSSLALLVGFLLVGIPALDTCLVIVSRTRRGVWVLTGGRDHLTHRTRQRMGTPRRVALVLGGAQALLSALVILASREGSSTLVYIVLAFVVFAAAAIVALEDAIPLELAGSDVAIGATGRSATQEPWARHFPAICLALVGLGAGLSPLFSAYYDPGIWVPIGLVLVVAAATATIARPPRFTLPMTLALVGLAGLGLWSLLSMGWAGAVEQASVSANLWLTYAALLLFLTVMISRRRHAHALLTAAGIGITVVAITVLVRMLGSNPSALFIAGRLNSPLGYINGEGCVFAMGCWLSLALAERRRPLLAGLGAAATVAMACLALLSQSRGAAIATFVAVLVALVMIPGFRRRVLALAFVAAGVAAAAGPVLHVYAAGAAGSVSASVAHHAVTAICLAAAGAGVAWGLLIALANAADARGGASSALLRRCATIVAILVIAAPVGTAIVRSSSLEQSLRDQWHAFVHLSDSSAASSATAQTRLFSGAGNRYDYWRVAWHVFLAHPLAGVGAGNYPEYYFLQRRTQEAIQNPHSIELQTLSELGVVGALLLVLVIAGVVLGARRMRAAARRSAGARTAMVAAMGVVVVWFVDSSGDWMHLLPGVTAIALCAVAALCGAGDLDAAGIARQSGRRLRMLLGAAGATFVLAVGGASLLRAGLSRHYLDGARAALPADPAAAIDDAQQVLRVDGANLDAYYVKAAGQARFDRAAAARSTLLEAVGEDPANFVTWTLLGDLEVRAGDLRAARSYYRHARSLDPREPALAALVADPAGAARTSKP